MAADKFQALRRDIVKGRLLLPGDDGFEDRLKRWSATNIKPAAAVVQPASAQEVSAVVKFAVANGIKFNVRGGGHSTSMASCAPSPEGMVLDLGLLRDVSVDADALTVSFGGGCIWRDVDDALAPHGLATPGGTVSHTGVGGLVLHGGFGVLTGLHGLVIDVLQACEVVLADGSVVTASERENSDLFWALRGAGSSFGVVTKFTSRVFPQGQIWGGAIIFGQDKLPQVIDFVNHWHDKTDGRQGFVVMCMHAPPAPGSDDMAPRPRVIMVQVYHVGPDPEKRGPEFFKPLLDAEPMMQQVGPMPYDRINKLGDDTAFSIGRRYQFGGSTFRAPLKVGAFKEMHDSFWDFVDSNQVAELQGSVFMLECIPRAKLMEVALDATSCSNRGPEYNAGIVWAWNDASHDQMVREHNREFQKQVAVLGQKGVEQPTGSGSGYLNYVDNAPLSAESAFGKNAARLRRLKQTYDPTNVFDKLWKLVGKVEEQWAAA